MQNKLFMISSYIASYGDKKYFNLDERTILNFEERIDKMDEELPPLKNFILPGGSIQSSNLHIGFHYIIK